MDEILTKLKELDLLSLSSVLYAFFRISDQINMVGIEIPDITKILQEFQGKLERTKVFRNQENKALSTVILFMKEYLYDDIMFLSTAVEVYFLFCWNSNPIN